MQEVLEKWIFFFPQKNIYSLTKASWYKVFELAPHFGLGPFLCLSVLAFYATCSLTKESFLWRNTSTCGQILLVSVPEKVCRTPLLLEGRRKTELAFNVCVAVKHYLQQIKHIKQQSKSDMYYFHPLKPTLSIIFCSQSAVSCTSIKWWTASQTLW